MGYLLLPAGNSSHPFSEMKLSTKIPISKSRKPSLQEIRSLSQSTGPGRGGEARAYFEQQGPGCRQWASWSGIGYHIGGSTEGHCDCRAHFHRYNSVSYMFRHLHHPSALLMSERVNHHILSRLHSFEAKFIASALQIVDTL